MWNDRKDYFISIFYSTEDGGYIADIPDLYFCSAFGETPEEALREVQHAKAAWVETAHASGKTIPKLQYRPATIEMCCGTMTEEGRAYRMSVA